MYTFAICSHLIQQLTAQLQYASPTKEEKNQTKHPLPT